METQTELGSIQSLKSMRTELYETLVREKHNTMPYVIASRKLKEINSLIFEKEQIIEKE